MMMYMKCKKKHDQVCRILKILHFEKTNFCNPVKGYRKINEQKDIVKNVTGSKGFEYTRLKLYDNEIRA